MRVCVLACVVFLGSMCLSPTAFAQNAPMAVTVIDGKPLTRANISNVAPLKNRAAGLLAHAVLNDSVSVSTPDFQSSPGGPSFGKSVAVFLDGIFSAHAVGFLSPNIMGAAVSGSEMLLAIALQFSIRRWTGEV